MSDLHLVSGKELGLREDRRYFQRVCPKCGDKAWVQYLPKKYQPPPDPNRKCHKCQISTNGFNAHQYLGPRDKYRAF